MNPERPLKTIFPDSSWAKRLAIKALRLYAKTLPQNPPPFPPPGDAHVKILIQSMGGIGNTLMATPLIAATRKLYPNAQIDLLTTPAAAELLRTNPNLSNVLADQDGDDHSTAGYRALQRRIRSVRYDAVLLSLNAVTFRFAARSVLARIPNRIIHAYPFHSYDDFTSAFTSRVPRDNEAHDVVNNLELLRALSGEEASVERLALTISNDELAQARNTLTALGWDDSKKTVALCPGSSGWMSFKRWPLESYISLARKVVSELAGTNVIVFSGPDEESELPTWKRELPEDHCIVVTGLSLRAYAGALTLCNAVVTNDSLPMHMCAALQVHSIALFGPTNPKRTGPWMSPSTVMEAKTDFTPYVEIPYPPDPAQFPASMQTITIDDVFHAVRTHLE